jgi:hypothetical protein
MTLRPNCTPYNAATFCARRLLAIRRPFILLLSAEIMVRSSAT